MNRLVCKIHYYCLITLCINCNLPHIRHLQSGDHVTHTRYRKVLINFLNTGYRSVKVFPITSTAQESRSLLWPTSCTRMAALRLVQFRRPISALSLRPLAAAGRSPLVYGVDPITLPCSHPGQQWRGSSTGARTTSWLKRKLYTLLAVAGISGAALFYVSWCALLRTSMQASGGLTMYARGITPIDSAITTVTAVD